MEISTRRRSRLLLLAGLAIVGVAAAFAWFAWRQRQLDAEALEARTAGLAALEARDWPRALDGLGRYLGRAAEQGSATATDYVRYAKARRNVVLPNNRNISEAVACLKKAHDMEPSNEEAQNDLLDLYRAAGYAVEAVALIDTMLVTRPDDLTLLRRKSDILEAQRRFDKALEVAQTIHARFPGDVDGAYRVYRLMLASGVLSSKVDAWVDATVAAHAGDVRFELIAAANASRRGETDKANALLDRVVAALKDSDDVATASAVVGELDAAGRSDDSLTVILGLRTDDAEVRREMVRRLWFAGRTEELIERTAAARGAAADADAEIVALRALALLSAGKSEESAALREVLVRRGDDVSKAWAAMLRHTGSPSAELLDTVLADMTAAVAAVPDSAILRHALGDARAALGEFELAIQAWTEAAARAQSWSLPLQSVARALMRTPGREALAPAIAKEARKRSPRDVDAMRTYVEAAIVASKDVSDTERAALFQGVEKFATSLPEGITAFLPVEIGTLAATDRSAAEKRLREVLESKARPDEATLLRLARIAAASGSTLENSFLDMSEQTYGVTPQLALARAVGRAANADSEASIRAFDELRGRAAAGALPLDWDLARASLLDALRRPDAGASWIQLADSRPATISVQLGALASPAVWTNLDAVERVIDRVKELTHGEGLTWRLARARLLLGSPSATEAELGDAAALLRAALQLAPTSTPAHLLLAKVLERTDDAPGAEEQLRLAADLAPQSPWIALEIARLALSQGHVDVARPHLERALDMKNLEPEQIETAAYLVALQGDRRRGSGLLEPLVARPNARRESVLLLARLYARLGELGRAITLCERLLAAPDAAAIELAADLYQASGRKVDAEAVLRRLDGAGGKPGDAELVRARFCSKWRDPAGAREWYAKAVAAAPERDEMWAAYLSFAVGENDAALIRKIVDDPAGSRRVPVRSFAALEDILPAVLKDGDLRTIVQSAIGDRAGWTASAEAVRAVIESGDDTAGRSAAARRVRTLADSNPRALPVQILAAELVARTGDVRAASSIAMRAVAAFPQEAAPAMQLTGFLIARGAWAEVLNSARTWRERAPVQDIMPSVVAAEALMRLGRPAEAVTELAPRIARALDRASANRACIRLYAVGLLRTNRTDDARRMLTKLAARDPVWQTEPLHAPPEWLGDAPTAKAWVALCRELLPAEDAGSLVAFARAQGGIAACLQAPELRDEARAIAESVAKQPEASAEAHFVAGTLALDAGDLPTAKIAYMAALSRDDKRLDALNNLAIVLADLGEHDKAIEVARKAVAALPGSPELRDTLAYVFRKAGKFDEAKSSLAEAMRIEPANATWKISLGEALWDAGDADGARRVVAELEDLVAAGPELPAATRDRLAKIRCRR
jgi:tetratricopeptide (TPR) repeat protein